MSNEQTPTKPWRDAALRDVHRLARMAGMDDDAWREFLFGGWGVTSSKDLDDASLVTLRTRLREIVDPEGAKSDAAARAELAKWRKRAFGIVADFLKRGGYRADGESIATTICRATRRESFSRVPLWALKQVYHNFRRKVEVDMGADAVRELLTRPTIEN